MNVTVNKKKESKSNLRKKINQHQENRKNKKASVMKNVNIQGNFLRVKLSSSILKFSSIYGVKKTWVQILLVTFVSIFSGLIGVFLLQNTGLYNVGFEAFAQGIGRLVSYLVEGDVKAKQTIMNALFWSLIIVVNIPLIFFGWYKIGKRFTLLSTYYIVVSSLFGLGMGYIPGIEKIFIFSDATPLSLMETNGIQIAIWDSQHDSISQLSLLIYGFVYGFLQALCYVILFIIEASSGGLDFIVVWYAEKKYKNLGTVFTYFNVLCFIISYIFGTYIPASLAIQHNNGILSDDAILSTRQTVATAWGISLFFSPNFVGSILMAIVLGITLNAFFPKYQMSKVEIFSKYVNEIRDYLIKENKPYSISIKTIEGGYSKLPQKILMTNCMYVDSAELLKIVREYDPNALFIVTLIKNIDGYVYVEAKQEENISFKKFLKNVNIFSKNKKQIIQDDAARTIEFELDENLVDQIDESIVFDQNQPSLKVIEASEVYDEELEKTTKENLLIKEKKMEDEEEHNLFSNSLKVIEASEVYDEKMKKDSDKKQNENEN